MIPHALRNIEPSADIPAQADVKATHGNQQLLYRTLWYSIDFLFETCPTLFQNRQVVCRKCRLNRLVNTRSSSRHFRIFRKYLFTKLQRGTSNRRACAQKDFSIPKYFNLSGAPDFCKLVRTPHRSVKIERMCLFPWK